MSLVLPPQIFAGRTVLIIGPAVGVDEELRNIDERKFDFLIRMNNGITLAADPANRVGARTDILFHNFKETGSRSAGQLSQHLLENAGVRHVIYTHAAPGRLSEVLRARRRIRALRSRADLRLVPPKLYDRVARALGNWEPTTGTVAIAYALAGSPRRLGIVGFSFFQTPYQQGYNPALGSDVDPLTWAREGGSHDPVSDREYVRKLLLEGANSGTELQIGDQVRRHLGIPAVIESARDDE